MRGEKWLADYTFIYTITLFLLVLGLWFLHILFGRALGSNVLPLISTRVDEVYGYIQLILLLESTIINGLETSCADRLLAMKLKRFCDKTRA